ncbi:MAG: hypothetical protein CMP48_12285 [Rickettsiales bacterium]|nr:hypothetical protein [Rickettsiales bacterium]
MNPAAPKNLIISNLLFFLMYFGSIGASANQKIAIERLLQVGDSILDLSPTRAGQFYEQALLYALKEGDSTTLANCYARVGHVNYLVGNYYEALSYHQNALEIFKSKGLDSLAAEEISRIGSIYYFSDLHDQEKALAYFEDAYKAFEKLGLDESAGLNLNYSGYVHWANGEKEIALSIHRQAYDYFVSNKDSLGMATSMSDIGFTLNSLQRFDDGLIANLNALELEKKLSEPIMMVPTLNNIGISYQGLNQLDKSLDYSLQSLRLAKERNLLLRQYEATQTLHKTYQLMNNYQKAYEVLAFHKQLSDSLNSTDQLRKILQLEIREDFKIKQLETETQYQIAELELESEKKSNKRLWIISFLISLLLVVSIIFLLKNKKKNKALASKQADLKESNTTLKSTLKHLRATQTHLVQMEKMASLGVLSAGVAHEINNAMNHIQGGVSTFQRSLEAPGTIDQEDLNIMIKQMQSGIKRASSVANELMRFNAMDNYKTLSKVDISSEIEHCILILKPKMSDQINVLTEFDSNANIITTNESALHQILMSLLQNATEAIIGSGTITIATEKMESFLRITISDTGKGIEPTVLHQIYDPFYTTKDVGKGTGLGLSLTFNLVERLAGTINHESEPGKGTRVIVELPQ